MKTNNIRPWHTLGCCYFFFAADADGNCADANYYWHAEDEDRRGGEEGEVTDENN